MAILKKVGFISSISSKNHRTISLTFRRNLTNQPFPSIGELELVEAIVFLMKVTLVDC